MLIVISVIILSANASIPLFVQFSDLTPDGSARNRPGTERIATNN